MIKEEFCGKVFIFFFRLFVGEFGWRGTIGLLEGEGLRDLDMSPVS